MSRLKPKTDPRQVSHLLSDEQLAHFIANGFVCVPSGLSSDLHDSIATRLEQVLKSAPNPVNRVCNNLFPLVPEFEEVINSPALRDAVASLLGPDYLINGHKALQPNFPNMKFRPSRGWHQDAYFADYRPQCIPMKVLDHVPWSLIVFYTPVDILNLDRGPTDLVAGSQYCTLQPSETVRYFGRRRRVAELLQQRGIGSNLPFSFRRQLKRHLHTHQCPVLVPKGTFTIIHHDLWHSGTFNITPHHRNLVKIEFTRCSMPTSPTWQHSSPQWPGPTLQGPLAESQPNTHLAIWNALIGSTPNRRMRATDLPFLSAGGDTVDEEVFTERAYTLANRGEDEELNTLMEILKGAQGLMGKNPPDRPYDPRSVAGHALESCTPANPTAAVQKVITLLSHNDEKCRAYACRILATWQVGKFLRKKAAPLVLQLADDSSDFVRGQVAVAAGRFKECCPQTVATLVRKLLQDRNEFVRQYAAQNLVGVREFSASDLPVLRRALQDELRDVKYFALEALMRTHQPEAWAIAAKHLRYYYWCAASANGPPY